MEYLASPFYQLIALSGLLLLTALVSRFNSKVILLFGFYYSCIWLFVSLFYGVFFENMWSYILYTAISLLVYYAVWAGLAYVSEKFGMAYDSDGWMIMLVPLNVFVLALLFAFVSRGLMYLYYMIF